MAHDDIPENETQSYQCPECKTGRVQKIGFDWTCDNCSFFAEVEEDDES